MKMITYELTVYISNPVLTDTFLYVTLMSKEGQSERTRISVAPSNSSISEPQVSHSTLTWEAPIKELELIELEKEPSKSPEDALFPSKVEVTSSEGQTYIFPIYTWIDDSKEQRFAEDNEQRLQNPEASGTESVPEMEGYWGVPLQANSRSSAKSFANKYGWKSHEGFDRPHRMNADRHWSLPSEVRFTFPKNGHFYITAFKGKLWKLFKGWFSRTEKWSSIDQINQVFDCGITEMVVAEYVHAHWKDDDFFGYQFLNGVNPMMIKRCKALPDKFPVTDDMISLHGGGSLTDEMEKGNIFLCDYEILDGVKANKIIGKQQYLMAPLVLLQKTPDDKMMPVAIQLKQKPGEDNPIFFPSDSEYDWLLAKIFVRSADFNVHELNSHLLRTHLLAEVFTVSLLRNVHRVHPLYKLLVPHTRYTLHINLLARQSLIARNGVFTKFTASGGEGMYTILSRALSSMTYRSLCIPDDITDRGLQDVPNFYYRDDGLRLWDIIHSFVKGILGHYYKNDDEVVNDTELQKWIEDIFEHGFNSSEKTKDTENKGGVNSLIPEKFTTVDELVKFVTMVIFTGSAQHAAVNNGQYDFGSWMPNTPISLEKAPPTKKGEATEARILETLPDVTVTVEGMNVLWLLSKTPADFVKLGDYPRDHFTEEIPCEKIQDFQKELKELSKSIQERNKKLELPYKYLDPAQIENSVAI